MNKFLLFVSLIFFSLAIMTNFLFRVKQPSWQNATIDPDRARRFVTVLMNNHTPSVLYFDEKDLGGVLHSSPTRLNLVTWLRDGLNYFNPTRTWTTQTIDKGEQIGLFTTGIYDDRGILHAVYQDGTLGKEKLYYAYFDGKNWSKKEVVDDAASSGINVGVFASISMINGSPVIFYHTEQGQRFGYAIRSSSPQSPQQPQSPQWSRKTLEKGVGWLTSSTSCGNSVFVTYRSRDTQEIHLGELQSTTTNDQRPTTNDQRLPSYNWSSAPLSASASTGLAITTKLTTNDQRPTTNDQRPTTNDSPCHPFVSYFAPVDNTGHGKILFYDSVAKKLSTIDEDGYLSRISLASNKQGFHAVYNVEDKGLFYATSPDGVDWKTLLLAPGKYTGSYNSLSADDSGNVAIAYVDGSTLKFMEYNVSSVNTMKKMKTILSIALISLGILGLTGRQMVTRLGLGEK